MSEIDINDLGSIGAVADTPPYMLPPEAWSQMLNMRILNGAPARLSGWEQVFGTPAGAPHFMVPVSTQATTYWVYVSLTNAYLYDGSTHSDITRLVGGAYTANATEDWNATLLGGVLIMNNGNDVPQYWTPLPAGTKMLDLIAWPAGLRAKVIRAFGPFLIAFNLLDGSDSLPHTIQWSHPASPGSLPNSWDYTDPTVDAGRVDLPDVNAGVIVDALPLGEFMYVYKESSTRRMRFVGGQSKFDIGFSAWLPTLGLLAPRCVALTPDGTKHVLCTQDDIVWHNGNQVNSILDRRQKNRLFSDIDSVNYVTSFMFANPPNNEMWFCYPGQGQVYPDRGLILKIQGEGFIVTEVDGITFRNATSGPIETISDEDWEGTGLSTAVQEQIWEDDTGPWSEVQRRRVVLAGTNATKFYNLDKGLTRDGASFNGILRREGLALLGRKRDGSWIVDHQAYKMFSRFWPKIRGGPVRTRFGGQDKVDGPVTWGDYVTFDPMTMDTADPMPVSGRAVGVEFSTVISVDWAIDGYKIDVKKLGSF